MILFVVAAILAFLLTRLPQAVPGSLLALMLLVGSAVLAVSGFERALVPAVAGALLLGLAVPAGKYAQRSLRVAPPRRRPAKVASDDGASERPKSFESLEVPGYEFMEKVGSGGMASVYRARRKSDGKIVAMKIPMEQYVADAKFIRRFHREAEVAARLDHQNIVRTYDHGSVGVKHYMAMEFVDGRSLESYIESNELDIPLGVQVMKRVVEALQHIHSAGIIHRDIKPANIMIVRGSVTGSGANQVIASDGVKLMDFGIAGGKILSRLTMTGARVGTPVYMSPEQARGLKIDHRSDIYSLGLVFYEMLTGQTAFKGGYEAIVHQQIFQTPPPPRQLNLATPKAIDSLVMRMISKESADRPALDEVLEALSGDIYEEPQAELPSRILLTVSARQGVVRILDPSGNLHASLGDIGMGEGRFSAAPLSLTVDSSGNLYVAIFEYRVGQDSHPMIHKLTPDGRTLHSFGMYGMKEGEFLYPIAIAVAPDDTVYVLDSETHLVQKFDANGRFVHSFGGRGDGRGAFNDPRTVTVAADGSVYVLDYGNRQVQRFDENGSYLARWAFRMSRDSQEMRILDGFTTDRHGNLYVSDASGGKIRQITADGKVGRSFEFAPLQGEATDALLDLGVDHEGHLYATRRGGHLIRKFTPDGVQLPNLETYAPVVQMTLDVRPEPRAAHGDLRLEVPASLLE